MTRYLLAIDQGTTGSTALVMGIDGRTLGRESEELPQHFPAPAWVEHDPAEICASVERAVQGALRQAGVSGTDIAALGITNQRETTLVWDRASGRPIHRAIVWQDRRTADVCQRLREEGHEATVRERTGLVLDPYFSATKIAWLLDEKGERARAEAGALAFGTVDSYLVWWLAGGAAAAAPHVIEISNASRTSLMHLETGRWDAELCALFRVPPAVLPAIVPTTGEVARTRGFAPLPDGVPITGIAGDQQAALFGQACFEPGSAKCTYGTGAFLVVNTGARRVHSQHGLLSTIAWQIGGETLYALEGSCFVAGAAVQWLRDGLGLIRSSSEVEALARSVSSSEGVVFVPALSGLGAPHWDPEARGLISGLTRGSNKGHIARATLEAIAFQVADLVAAIREDLALAGGGGVSAAARSPGGQFTVAQLPGRQSPGLPGGQAPGDPRPDVGPPHDRLSDDRFSAGVAGRISDARLRVERIRVDGGAAQNNLLMQFQSDISNLCIERPLDLESTARGAAMLAGVGAGIFASVSDAAQMVEHPERFDPIMTDPVRAEHLARWHDAVRRTRSSESGGASGGGVSGNGSARAGLEDDVH
jgi:glycerol kinase